MLRLLLPTFASVLFLAAPHAPAQAPPPATTAVTHASTTLGILTKDQAGSILPPSVFFRGQSAPIQARNSAGIRLSPDALLLVALVDTSGYSSAVQQRYQAYLITEAPIRVAGHSLASGAYGVGFIANDQFLVMDIGGHQLFTAPYSHDTALRRPNPLQITPDTKQPNAYRLYSGRSFIAFSADAAAANPAQ